MRFNMDSQMEKILDICLEKIEEGIPLDKILMEYPEHREELRELLTIAKDIENAPLPSLRDEAMDFCLIKVHKALQIQKKTGWRARLPRLQWPRLLPFPSPSWAKALAFVLILVFVSWGGVNLSADSLPGDPLYPIKLATAKVRCFLTIEPEGKAKLRLAYLEGLKSKVSSSQRQDLENAIRTCTHRAEWMGKVRRNEVPIGEWGPFHDW